MKIIAYTLNGALVVEQGNTKPRITKQLTETDNAYMVFLDILTVNGIRGGSVEFVHTNAQSMVMAVDIPDGVTLVASVPPMCIRWRYQDGNLSKVGTLDGAMIATDVPLRWFIEQGLDVIGQYFTDDMLHYVTVSAATAASTTNANK